MKSIFDMSGVERAAALLVALGSDIASDIIKHLDEPSIEKLTIEMAKITELSLEDREELIGEFLIDLRRNKRIVKGGKNKAEELLQDAFGKDKAESIIKKIRTKDIDKEFEFLKEIDPNILFQFIKDESIQTLAVLLQYIPPEKSASLLQLMPKEKAKDIALRMAKTTEIVPEAVLGIIEVIKKKYHQHRKKSEGFTNIGGVDSLVSILGHMKGEDEKNIMNSIESSMPSVSQNIREKIYAFENVVQLSNNEIRILIDEINNDVVVAKALKGAGDEIRFKFFRNMSQNRATDVLQEMDEMGAIKLTEVEDCRKVIVTIMQELHDNGVINLRKSNEQYVE